MQAYMHPYVTIPSYTSYPTFPYLSMDYYSYPQLPQPYYMPPLCAEIQQQGEQTLSMTINALTPDTSIQDYFSSCSANIIVKTIANIYTKAAFLQNPNYALKQPYDISLSYDEWEAMCSNIINRSNTKNTKLMGTQENTLNLLSKSILFTPYIRRIVFNMIKSVDFQTTSGIIKRCSLHQLQDFLQNYSNKTSFLFNILKNNGEETYINKEQCIKSLYMIFHIIETYFNQENLIEAILYHPNYSRNSCEDQSLYLRLMGSIQKNEDKKMIIQEILEMLFRQAQFLDQSSFQDRISWVSEKCHNFLDTIFNLIKLEVRSLNLQYDFESHPNHKNSELSYYRKLVEKIQNKCKGREDELCNCKKCLCIKRNRQSARESQRKKKDALDKILVVQTQFDEVTKKIKLAEDTNKQLKQILSDAMKYPDINQIISLLHKDKVSDLIKKIEEPNSTVSTNELSSDQIV